MSQTIAVKQTPQMLGRIDGHTNYASRDFIVANGVTVNQGDFVYLTSGTLSSATITGDSRPIGMCEATVVGDGTKTATVCIDPMMQYLLPSNTALSATSIGQYFDLTGATGAQQVLTSSASSTTGLVLCLAQNVNVGIQGTQTTSYGVFKLIESALSPLGS